MLAGFVAFPRFGPGLFGVAVGRTRAASEYVRLLGWLSGRDLAGGRGDVTEVVEVFGQGVSSASVLRDGK